MNAKHYILGLDMGTNSIGWAAIDAETQQIIATGSRIIPMDERSITDFDKGVLQSSAAQRTLYHRMRITNERAKQRRERLLRVLNILGFLPEHFRQQIDFEKHFGQFKNHNEPLIAYCPDATGKKGFLFRQSFEEMLNEFRQIHPELVAEGKKIPYDWTLYYLRKKALTQPVSREELAWILLSFNAKRGYYQLRGMSDELQTADDQKQFCVLTVMQVNQGKEVKAGSQTYEYHIVYDNGKEETKKGKQAPYPIGHQFEAICTTKTNKDGTTTFSTSTPDPEDWTLVKKKTEHDIKLSGKTVGAYIYDEILAQPSVKVRGKLIHTIDRSFYRSEMEQILRAQTAFHKELRDDVLLRRCANELYRRPERQPRIEQLVKQGFLHLLVDDVLFYQRPLKSKKSEIADCPFEQYHYVNRSTGECVDEPVKCIPKSHPLFQEYRLWQFIHNLRIYQKEAEVNGRMVLNYDVTDHFLPNHEVRCQLFDYLNERADVKESVLLKFKPFGLSKKADLERYRWNYPSENTYPCNKTLYTIPKGYRRYFNQKLWHILYSVSDPEQIVKALRSFATEHQIPDADAFVASLTSVVFSEKDYGSFSEKALKKLLPLMRCGSRWQSSAIDEATQERIQHFLHEPSHEDFSDSVRKALANCHCIEAFQGLPVYQACYAVYGRHSEATDLTAWKSPDELAYFLRYTFKQHSLRNPVVERIVLETLRIVEDLWRKYGKMDEIHVEMGRNLKQNAEGRKRDYDRNQENQAANYRARRLLQEFARYETDIENLRPHSPYQQDLFRLYEEEVLGNYADEVKKDKQIAKTIQSLGRPLEACKVTASEVHRYRLWLDQKCKSPYTGQPISLARLFTRDYEIEHVIPKTRYYNDSMNNKVICEAEVNKDKGNMTGYEYILQRGGSIVQGAFGKTFTILKREEYEDYINLHFKHNRAKKANLLMEDVPAEFSERMLNDTRYMSRVVLSLLSKVVRDDDEVSSVSKHVLPTNGSITTRLKSDWGINDVWNDLIAPRFQRMNERMHTDAFGEMRNESGKRFFQPRLPLDIPQIDKKRIDHRHHAMDAIVIACTTRNHITYLNSVSSHDGDNATRIDLRTKLCLKHHTDANGNYQWLFKKPWESFTQDVRAALSNIVVSFKQNLRVLTSSKKGGSSIRKPLHKETFSGKVLLQQVKTISLKDALADWHQIKDKALRQEIKRLLAEVYPAGNVSQLIKHFKLQKNLFNGKDIRKVEVYTYSQGEETQVANRKLLDKTLTLKQIESITDSGIRKILMRHLANYQDAAGKYRTEEAFSPEGLAEMNAHIRELNDGKPHQPVYKARFSEIQGQKFAVGQSGAKAKQFVEAAKGTNLFFAIYANEDGKRSYETIPLQDVIARRKRKEEVAPSVNEHGERLLFTLSPGDLVYLPTEEDVVPQVLDKKRIYKVVSFSKRQCFFVPQSFSTTLYDKCEWGSMNKIELTDNKENIKALCVKLKVNRLGEIIEIIDGQ